MCNYDFFFFSSKYRESSAFFVSKIINFIENFAKTSEEYALVNSLPIDWCIVHINDDWRSTGAPIDNVLTEVGDDD